MVTRSVRAKRKDTPSMLELEAIGTHWWIELLEAEWTSELQALVTSEIHSFEDNYTRFRDESLLGQLNLHKCLADPPEELVQMLAYARDLQNETDGVFNISVGGELVRRGYGKTGQGSVSANFWNEVKLTPEEIRIPGEISLDLGGLGKGWLIDKLGRLLKAQNRPHYIINGGGDILVSSPEPVELALEHPYNQGKVIGTTRITHGALAVSSTMKRSWEKDGQRQHHIIDPRTGKPSESDIVSTYIRADTALVADTCATILLIAPELDAQLTRVHHLKTILLRHT
jgi:thiamine biosynthesis lipoprotein